MGKMNRQDFEISAPVGSMESLMAAIQAGADSVYFGSGKLNMRSRSSRNFSGKEVETIVRRAHRHKVRVYLALNSVIYDRDLREIEKMLSLAIRNKVDAVIASDISVIKRAREAGLSVHLSTQLNISNTEALKFYSEFADVVVLTRELDLKQVSDIYLAIEDEKITGPAGRPVRIEMFIHGALCMAISGKCYLSLHQYGESANRGSCLQPCRRSYILREKETGKEIEVDQEYLLSPKDLCTIGFIDKIMESGARVLKIEGRARSPEYVYQTVNCYDEAVRAVTEGRYAPGLVSQLEERLKTVFNRGFWDGYYLGRKMGSWAGGYGSLATRKRVYIGKGINYFSRIGVAEFKLEAGDLRPGDDILITGPASGVYQTRVREIRVDKEPVLRAGPGENVSLALERKVRRSDKLFKIVNSRE